MKFAIKLFFYSIFFLNYKVGYTQIGKAESILYASVDAMGGKDILNSLTSLKYTAKGHENMLEQSERPQGPYMVSYFTVQSEKSLTDSKLLYSLKYASNTRPYQILVDHGRVAAIAGKNLFPMYQEMDEQIVLAPENVLFTALQSTPYYIKDTILQDINHHVVGFIWNKRPIRLFINQFTRLLTGVEITRYYSSNFNYVWGDTKRVTFYSFWHLEKNGLHYPYQSDVFVNGRHFSSMTLDSLQINVVTSVDSLQITDSAFAKMQIMKRMIDPLQRPNLKPMEIASGIHFLPGNWNTSFVKTDEGIYVIEAPISSVYSVAVLDEVKRAYPNMKLAGVISTSDAWPHIGGIREYVAQSVPIYILDVNTGIIKDMLSSKHSTFPDQLFIKPQAPLIKSIGRKTKLGIGDNAMEIYPMRTESGERMMVVYFPAKKLLYTSDMVQPNSKGGFFMKQYLSEIRDVITREKLTVDNIFGMHLSITSYSKLITALE